MQQPHYSEYQYSQQGFMPNPYGGGGQQQSDNIKRNRRGGKKRRGGVAHRRRQQAYLAAQQRMMEEGEFYDPQANRQRQPGRTRPTRSIQKGPLKFDKLDMDNVPMTPSLAALTPRTRSLTIGQILLARALVSEVIGGNDRAPLSRKELEGVPTPRAPNLSSDEEFLPSPRTVSSLPRSPPLQPQEPPHVDIPAPSPSSAMKLSKEEFQALVNARVNRSISQRLSTASFPTAKPAPAPKKDRFSTVYRTPGGQTISFKHTGKNTPPTPRYGGEKVAAAVDVEWSAYEAVHGPQTGTSQRHDDSTWRVTPAHIERTSESLWSSTAVSSSSHNPSSYSQKFGSFEEFDWLPPEPKHQNENDDTVVNNDDESSEDEDNNIDIKFGFGFD